MHRPGPHAPAGVRAAVAVWPWSLRRDTLQTSAVKTAVAWYCIVIGVVMAAWSGWGDLREDAAVRGFIRTHPFVAFCPATTSPA